MTYRQNCRSRSRGIHSHSARNNSESNHPTIQTTTIRPAGRGVPKGDSITPPPSNNQNTQSDKPRASQPKRHDSKPHICQGPTGNQNHPKVSPAVIDVTPGLLPDNATHVKMGRISPSPSRAFTPHYSHSLNSIPSITPLTTRTFTLSFSRSLKNLKTRTLTT